MKSLNEKVLYIYLFVYAILWTLIGSLKNSGGVDALEAISWGDLVSFGTNKHPPFSGWLMGGFYHLLGDNDIAIYILGQICLLVGFVFIYKLAKNFLTEEKAIGATVIISITFYYAYQTFIDNFNCNIISMCLWPILVYYFYKSIKENKIKDWSLLGFIAGISFLAKYQVAFLFISMFLYLLLFDRKQFTKMGLYVAGIVATLVVLPHFVWLYQNDFFSMNYIMGRTNVDINNTPISLVKYGRIVFPIKFYGDQILAMMPCFAIYLIAALRGKEIKFDNTKENFSDKMFLVFVGLLPMVILGGMGLITGNRVVGNWGSTMIGFCGILLFYFFPIKFDKEIFKYFMKWIVAIVCLWVIGVSIFLFLQTKMVVGYPHQMIMKDFDEIWATETNNAPLKYVLGHPFYIFQFNVYDKQKPTIVLDTHGHSNPWISEEEVIKNGVLVIMENKNNFEQKVRNYLPSLPSNYKLKPKKYTFKITNKINKSQEYDVYYEIIPPAKAF